MKNKLVMAGIAIVSIFSLAACKQGEKANYDALRKDAPSASIAATFNLFIDKEATNPYAKAKKLDAETEKSGSYYDIYIANDTDSSLFVYNWNMDDYLKDKGANARSASVTSYVFKDCLYEEEKTAVLSQAFDTKTGIQTILTDIKVDTTQSMDKTISTTAAYKAYEDKNSVFMSVVYMPIYVEHFVSGKVKLQLYIFLPVYLTVITDGKEVTLDGDSYKLVDSTIASITKTIDLAEYTEGPGLLKYE